MALSLEIPTLRIPIPTYRLSISDYLSLLTMVTKTTDHAPAEAAELEVAPTKNSSGLGGDSTNVAKEIPKQSQQESNKLDEPAAQEDKVKVKSISAAESVQLAALETKSTKKKSASRPAMQSPPAIPVAPSKAVATPASSTPKVPTKSASRQKKPLPPVSGQTLADPAVISGVNSIVALLQSYGPLSHEQLKFNMATQLVPLNQPNKSDSPDKLEKVLRILVELGIIHQVDKTTLGKNGSLMTKSAAKKLKEKKEGGESIEKQGESETTAVARIANQPDSNPIYCFGNGIPRMEVILPSKVLAEIKESGEEVLRMNKRIELLRNTLRDTDAAASKDKGRGGKDGDISHERAKGVLKQLLELHPEVVRDPVYAAALRMFKLKEGIPGLNEEDEERTLQNIHGSIGGKSGKRVSISSLGSADGSGKKKRKKGRPRKNSSASLEKSATGPSAVKANAQLT